MMHVEAKNKVQQLQELYPKWNPTTTQIEAIAHKLQPHDSELVKKIILDTYAPDQAQPPVAQILQALRRAYEDQKAKQQQEELKTIVPATEDEINANYRQLAGQGCPLAREMCRRKGIDWQK